MHGDSSEARGSGAQALIAASTSRWLLITTRPGQTSIGGTTAGLNKSPRYRLTAAAKAFSYARFAKHLDGPKQ